MFSHHLSFFGKPDHIVGIPWDTFISSCGIATMICGIKQGPEHGPMDQQLVEGYPLQKVCLFQAG